MQGAKYDVDYRGHGVGPGWVEQEWDLMWGWLADVAGSWQAGECWQYMGTEPIGTRPGSDTPLALCHCFRNRDLPRGMLNIRGSQQEWMGGRIYVKVFASREWSERWGVRPWLETAEAGAVWKVSEPARSEVELGAMIMRIMEG